MTLHDGTRPYIEITAPSIARIHDYLLGGNNHFGADRQAAEELKLTIPRITESVRDNRAFLRRTVRHLAARMGVRQFIDLSLCLPTQGSTHEIAQAANPDARVVYVNSDAATVLLSRALLTGQPGAAVVLGDLHAPDSIFGSPALRSLIDLDRPTAVLLLALLHLLEDPMAVVAHVLELLAPGGYLVIAEASSQPEVERYLTRARVLTPGVVDVREWRPELDVASPDTQKLLPWAAAA